MPLPPSAHPSAPVDAGNPFKSRGGWRRLIAATRYSAAGLSAAVRHEAAFRQELVLGLPMLAVAPWLGRSAVEVWMLVAVVVFVWVAELLNSAVEALADAVSPGPHPLVGRAKDIGSAAVMLCLLLAGGTWGWVLLDRFGGRLT